MNKLALSLLLATAPMAAAQVAQTEALRLEAGKQLAKGQEMRTWHFGEFKEPMQDWPREVKGAFLELRCEDQKFSEAALVLVRDDFRVRSYPAKLLSAEDRALAEKLEAARVARRPKPPASAAYKADYKTYDPVRDKDSVNFAETDHFVFYWGNDRTGIGKTLSDEPGFIDRNKAWFEKVWSFYETIGVPMPYADQAEKKKINVYISGTGLAKHKEGFAFGSAEVLMSPAALGAGSSVVCHEFTHSIQFYSGGFRDNSLVGYFWECHANWSSHQFMPMYAPTLAHYAGRAHYELNSSRHNYGSWPFLQTLAEDPRFGYSFPYVLWKQVKRDAAGKATEDPFQAIQRLGAEKGVWKNGLTGFGDTIGELAARMVQWDFQNQYAGLMDLRNALRHGGRAALTRTVLEPVADRPGWYRPIHSHAPRQFGVNLIELVPDPAAKTVEVDFAGIVDETEGSDWRVTLVAGGPQGAARYSPTLSGKGKVSMSVRPGETLTLAIAATPTVYKPLEFRMGYARKVRYPYELTMTGAKPASAPPISPFREVPGGPHPNGGGFVAKSAKVAPTAYVGPNARVLDVAEVSDNARIEDFAEVRNQTKVSGNAIIGGWARIDNRARVTENARVRGYAMISNQATIAGNARVIDYAKVEGRGTVNGDVLVKGFGEIELQPATELTGGTICGEDLEIHMLDVDQPKVSGGLIYGFMNKDQFRRPLPDNKYLYAHWTFNAPRQQVLKDAHTDCDGVLRGGPQFSTVDGRGVLSLDGKQYALVEGHVVDSRDITFDLQVNWAGGAPGQRLFEFGDAENSVLLALTQGGKPAFVIHKGKTNIATLQGTAAVPTGKWSRITVTVKDDVARLYIDGQLAGENKQFALNPEDVGARAGYLGRGVAPGFGFVGKLDDFAVYRTGFENFSDIPASVPSESAPAAR